MGKNSIPVYNLTVPCSGDMLTLQLRGDQHYGLNSLTKEEIVETYIEQQNIHKDKLFVVELGDLLEMNLNSSVGHGYDVRIRDPQVQLDDMKEAYQTITKHLYGEEVWNKLKFTGPGKQKTFQFCKHVGVIGNHEYRARTTTGIWVNSILYDHVKILDLGIRGIINLKIENKKAKISKTYSIFISHRPSAASSGQVSTITRNCQSMMSSAPYASIYLFGHYHRRMIWPHARYDKDGQCEKVLFAVCPSPIENTEYAEWAGYAPVESALYSNIYLPLDKNEQPWGHV